MARGNRVTPFGTLEAVAARGRMMGNRGDLHGRDGSIVATRRSGNLRWISCTLEEVLGRRVVFDTPGRYTPLFFADEAVALAAGHRPCRLCRDAAFRRFAAAWNRCHGRSPEVRVAVGEIDRRLDPLRGAADEHPRARLGDLPDGSFVVRPDAPETALLIWRGGLWPWSHQGYCDAVAIDGRDEVTVLTPAPIVAVLAAGYVPDVDPSAARRPALGTASDPADRDGR